jgi:hypothetical protein
MDSYIGDDLYSIFENNCKIRFLCEIKKTLLLYLIDYIVNDCGDTKYNDFDLNKYYMNDIIVTDIANKYDYYNDNIDTTGNLQCAILGIHGFDFVASYIKDPDLIGLANALSSNISNVINITAVSFISIIDNNIIKIKNINSNITIDNYLLSISNKTNNINAERNLQNLDFSNINLRKRKKVKKRRSQTF